MESVEMFGNRVGAWNGGRQFNQARQCASMTPATRGPRQEDFDKLLEGLSRLRERVAAEERGVR